MSKRLRVTVLRLTGGAALIALIVVGGVCASYIDLYCRSMRLRYLAVMCTKYAREQAHYPQASEGEPAWTALGKLVPDYLESARMFLLWWQGGRRQDRAALTRFKGHATLPQEIQISYSYMPPAGWPPDNGKSLVLAERPDMIWVPGKLLAAQANGAIVAMTAAELGAAIASSLSED